MITNNRNGLNRSPELTPESGKNSLASNHRSEFTETKRQHQREREFDQSFILQQSPHWSRAILWVLMGVTTAGIIWACFAKIESAVPAQGKLEPQGAVQDIQPPVSGVVQSIYVEDGQRVQQGEKLISLEPTADWAQLKALQQVRNTIVQENQFYRTQMSGLSDAAVVKQAIAKLKLPPEIISLTESRAALIAENQLFRAQIDGPRSGSLSPSQLERLQSDQAELSTRMEVAKLEVGQLTRQLQQAQIQLASAKDTLAMNQAILNDIEPLAIEGGLSRIQHMKQKQEVRNSQAEVEQQTQEQERLKLQIAAAQSKVQNTTASERKDLLSKIAENDKAIAGIDSELTKTVIENDKRIAEIDSQLSQTQLTLKYQELKAPVAGTVFDMQAHGPGYVANPGQPMLKIVPDDTLTAKVFITNRDIGFVRTGMPVDIRVDSFPFSEFGDIKGELVWIGSDALPPDELRQQYTFPAKVRLDQQSLSVNGREMPLQSGMSLSANIKVRKRTVMSIFTDLFTEQVESLRFMR